MAEIGPGRFAVTKLRFLILKKLMGDQELSMNFDYPVNTVVASCSYSSFLCCPILVWQKEWIIPSHSMITIQPQELNLIEDLRHALKRKLQELWLVESMPRESKLGIKIKCGLYNCKYRDILWPPRTLKRVSKTQILLFSYWNEYITSFLSKFRFKNPNSLV